MKTSTIILIAVGAVILLPMLTGSSGLLGGSSILNPNLAAQLTAKTDTSYASDATSVANSILSDFGSGTL
jgi:hypothetical protein